MARRILLALVALAAAAAVALAGTIYFSAPGTPDLLPTMRAGATALAGQLDDLPPHQEFSARDGTPIAYRAYPGAGERMAVLIHGSAASSFLMHLLARDLQGEGASVYALDVRGHGQSGRRGDIDYVGQIEHDLVDFLEHLGAPAVGARRVLIGYSAGGGFALRFAGGPEGERFDAYLLLAPFLGVDAPTLSAERGRWASAAVPRIVALALLNRFGIRQFNGLPVVGYAIPAEQRDNPALTPTYSFRLWANFGPNRDWQGDIRGIRRPARVLVGAEDELFMAEQFAPTIHALRPEIAVEIVPGAAHVQLVALEAANAVTVRAFRELIGP